MAKLVEFVADSYPHCKGDVVKLSEDELKAHGSKSYKAFSDAAARAADAQEAEVVEGKDKSVPTNETKAGDVTEAPEETAAPEEETAQ